MKTRITAGGRTRNVEVRLRQGNFLVLLDGQEHEVSVSEVNGVLSLLIGPPEGGPHVRVRGGRTGTWGPALAGPQL